MKGVLEHSQAAYPTMSDIWGKLKMAHSLQVVVMCCDVAVPGSRRFLQLSRRQSQEIDGLVPCSAEYEGVSDHQWSQLPQGSRFSPVGQAVAWSIGGNARAGQSVLHSSKEDDDRDSIRLV